MQSTIFDFRLNLEDANILFLIEDSLYEDIVVAEFKNKQVVDRVDFAIKSYVRMRDNSGQIQNLDIYDFCSNDKDCLRQTLYFGVYGYISLFNFDIENGDSYKPKFLLRDSKFIDVLKIKGYEYYGFLSNISKFLVRNYSVPRVISVGGILSKYDIPFDVSSTAQFQGQLLERRNPLLEPSHHGFGGDEYMYVLNDSSMYPIISTDYASRSYIWAEINREFWDTTYNVFIIRPLVYEDVLDDFVASHFMSLDYKVYDKSDAEDMVSIFGIMLHIQGDIEPLYSSAIYFKITQ